MKSSTTITERASTTSMFSRSSALAGAWICVCLASIGLVMWREDWRYAAPTPRPPGQVDVPLGTAVGLVPSVRAVLAAAPRSASSGLVLLHFYNPDCPCSRFNLDHVRGLVARFGEQVDIVLVVESDDAEQAARAAERVEPGLPWVDDNDGSVADHYGVFATPLAVIVDRDGALAFRGNYSTARYCVDPAQEHARLALESLVAGLPIAASAAAAPTYGCPLPSDVTLP